MTNTSYKQHQTGKPKGSSTKCLLKILITGKLKPYVFWRGEYVVYNVIKYKKGSMDDYIDSAENDDEGVGLYRQLKALWGVANMQARKWIFNLPKVIETKCQ